MTTSDNIWETPIPSMSCKDISITIERIPENNLPNLLIKFITSTLNDTTILNKFTISIIDRQSGNTKAYNIPEEGAIIFYNDKKQMCSFELLFSKEYEYDPAKSEFEKVLNLTKDIEAIQAYRVAAYHACALGLGYHITDARLGRVDAIQAVNDVGSFMEDPFESPESDSTDYS